MNYIDFTIRLFIAGIILAVCVIVAFMVYQFEYGKWYNGEGRLIGRNIGRLHV